MNFHTKYLVVEVSVLPVQRLLQHSLAPLVEAEDGPDGDAGRAAAAQAANQEPEKVERDELVQYFVHPVDGRPELLGGYL